MSQALWHRAVAGATVTVQGVSWGAHIAAGQEACPSLDMGNGRAYKLARRPP